MGLVSKGSKLFLVNIVVLLVACSSGPSFKTDYDYRSGMDFTGYQTFSWLGDEPLRISTDQSIVNPLVSQRIQDSVRLSLQNRGYTFSPSADKADFLLSFTLGARDKIKVTSYPVGYQGPYGWGGGYYHHGYGGGYMATETQVNQYVQGTLAIDVFDEKLKEPVWHGKAVGVLRQNNESNRQQVIDEVVEAILANFPPGSK